MRKNLFLLALVTMLLPFVASAETVEDNWIYFSLDKSSAKAEVVARPEKYSGHIIIPETIDCDGQTYTVTSIKGAYWRGHGNIDDGAFERCDGLISITIPKSITSIGYNAFNSSNSLKAVYISDLAAWCKIVFECQGNNSRLGDGLPTANPLHIAHDLYLNGELISELVIPDDIKEVSVFSFVGCSISSVVFHKQFKSIGIRAFDDCNNLKDVFCYSPRISPYGSLPNSVYEHSFTNPENKTLHIRERYSNYYLSKQGLFQGCGWDLFGKTEFIDGIDFTLSFNVDDKLYYQEIMEVGEPIKPATEPTKTGYVFSGWIDIPEIMPANDLVINGYLIPNTYKLTYMLNGKEYKVVDVKCGESVTPEPNPVRKGMTFSGWKNVPNTMPAIDVIVTGSLSWSRLSKDDVIYLVSDTILNHASIIESKNAHGDIILEETVNIDGYEYVLNVIGANAFNGCKSITSFVIPSTITSIEERAFANIGKLNDVTIYAENVPETDRTAFENSYIEDYVTLHVPGSAIKKYKETAPWKNFKEIVAIEGTGTVQTYKLTYMVDGEVYETFDINEGESITPESEPTKEGYTFSGWSEIPSTMPGNDVTVTGTFTINKYKLIYMVDGEVYMTIEVEYGATITPEDEPTKDGYVFSGWSWIPSKMPAEDVTISGTFKQVGYNINDNIYVVDGGYATLAKGNAIGDVVISPTIIINNTTYDVATIGQYAFSNNTEITSVTIPDGITIIGDNAFYGCSGIGKLTMGKDIWKIGSKAFAYIGTSASSRKRASSELLVIECHAESVPDAQYDSFEGIDMQNVIMKVNDDLVDSYKKVYPWNQFTNIVGFNESTGINSIYSENGSSIFSIDGRKIDKPQKGMNIIRTSQGTRKVMVK